MSIRDDGLVASGLQPQFLQAAVKADLLKEVRFEQFDCIAGVFEPHSGSSPADRRS
jgi:hypothetical protein